MSFEWYYSSCAAESGGRKAAVTEGAPNLDS